MYPEYLYHYTSISTLALILKEKRIRFNRLDNVDDLLEPNSADLGNLGRLFFVSCWSSSDEENIPLWSLYTPNMSGVRIKLPAKMFRTHVIRPQSNGSLHIYEEIKESPLPLERLVTDEYFVNPTIYNFESFLRKIEYINDESRLYPTISSRIGINTNYALGNFGIYKRPEWQFQSEWRYIIMIFPGPFDDMNANAEDFANRLQTGLRSKSLPFVSFYLDLENNILDNIEVTLGPKISKGDSVIVKTLLHSFCNNAIIKTSDFKIR